MFVLACIIGIQRRRSFYATLGGALCNRKLESPIRLSNLENPLQTTQWNRGSSSAIMLQDHDLSCMADIQRAVWSVREF